ncbi:MAG: ABC transporter ATP-binding protein, partial [Spongiibacter sp.]
VQIMDAGRITARCTAAQARQRFAPQAHFSNTLPIADAPEWPADQALIELREVSVNFRGKQVLSNINWTLMPNQHCCISGPNGSGKSTLLGLLCGENDKAYGQHVVLFGQRRGSGESIWEVKSRFGLLNTAMQLSNLKRTKVIDVIASGLFDSVGLYQDYSEAQRQNLLDWLNALELLPLREQRFERLSFGQQRMVLLARAMVKSPRVLILDEPCIGLDEQQKARLLGAVDQIARQGQTRILFVSHRREEVPACINQFLQLVPSEAGGYTANIS